MKIKNFIKQLNILNPEKDIILDLMLFDKSKGEYVKHMGLQFNEEDLTFPNHNDNGFQQHIKIILK